MQKKVNGVDSQSKRLFDASNDCARDESNSSSFDCAPLPVALFSPSSSPSSKEENSSSSSSSCFSSRHVDVRRRWRGPGVARRLHRPQLARGRLLSSRRGDEAGGPEALYRTFARVARQHLPGRRKEEEGEDREKRQKNEKTDASFCICIAVKKSLC